MKRLSVLQVCRSPQSCLRPMARQTCRAIWLLFCENCARATFRCSVGVGNTARPMDAELTRVNMPRKVLVGSRLNIETIVGLSGYGATKVLLSVREDGRTVKTEEFNLRGNDTQAVNLEITPTTVGTHRYTVEVTPLDGELTVENNKQDA